MGVVTRRIVLQALPDLAEPGHQIIGRFFSGRNPDDAVRERLLHDLVVTQRLGEDGLADAAHSPEGGQGDARALLLGEDGVAERFERIGAREVVARERRGGDV